MRDLYILVVLVVAVAFLVGYSIASGTQEVPLVYIPLNKQPFWR